MRGRSVETGRPLEVRVEQSSLSCVYDRESAPAVWLCPGLVDIQVNGYAGNDVNGPGVTAEDVGAMVARLWAIGTTTVCPTVITASEEAMAASVESVGRARSISAALSHSIACAHVEGPCISAEQGPLGAHPLEHVRPGDLAELEHWQEVSGGSVGVVTLAPETPGALGYIAELSRRGIVVGIGHTAAGPAVIRQAVEAGAKLSTHLGNGSHAYLPRLDNYVWEQLAEDRLWASFVADGHHVPAAALTVMLRAKGTGRSLLVSDCVALAGAPPGLYRSAVGGQVRLHEDGRLTMEGSPYLAGSVSDLMTGLLNATRLAGLPLSDAVRLAATNPARLLGLDQGPGARGHLAAGASADVVAFAWEVGEPRPRVVATVVAGQLVYATEGSEEVVVCAGC